MDTVKVIVDIGKPVPEQFYYGLPFIPNVNEVIQIEGVSYYVSIRKLIIHNNVSWCQLNLVECQFQ